MWLSNVQRVKQKAADFLKLDGKVQKQLKHDNPRKEITQQRPVWSGSVASLIEESKELAKEFRKKWTEVTLDTWVEEDYGSHSVSMALEVQGLETEEQYHARLFDVHHATQIREDYERREFERLKNKFGG